MRSLRYRPPRQKQLGYIDALIDEMHGCYSERGGEGTPEY